MGAIPKRRDTALQFIRLEPGRTETGGRVNNAFRVYTGRLLFLPLPEKTTEAGRNNMARRVREV